MERNVLSLEHVDGIADRSALAARFAPRLYLHDDEPFPITEIVPVLHPARPIIAYHIFYSEDAISVERASDLDREIVWVEYDPVTFKATDVATYWHRTVLRTDSCLMKAKAADQRPTVFVQWGQHGSLPLGWEALTGARPRIELRAHYRLFAPIGRKREGFLSRMSRFLSRILSRQPKVQVTFQGSYEDYLQFRQKVEAADYVTNQRIIVAEDPTEELKTRIKGTFPRKKDWPFWSPED